MVASQPTVMIVPPPRSIMPGKAAWISAYTPVRLTLMTASHSSRRSDQPGPHGRQPAHGDDRAAPALDHAGQGRLDQRVHTGEVDVDDSLPLLLPDPADIARLARVPRVVDENVHAP